MLSVQPICVKYWSPLMSSSHDILPMFPFFILMKIGIFHTLHIKEYPVFKPNDYFWKHYWKEGTEKYEVYSKVIRELMRESFDFKLYELNALDKAKYKSLLLNKEYKLD